MYFINLKGVIWILIDLTQAPKQGVLACPKAGSPTWTVETATWMNPKSGANDTMTYFSCGTHNVGTHIDTMGAQLSHIDRFIARGVKFDVSHVEGRAIELSDIDLTLNLKEHYVFLQTNWSQYYGTEKAFDHPYISEAVLDYLLCSEALMIGIDCMGLARGKHHLQFDQRAADKGIYIIENLCNLDQVPTQGFTTYCFPLKADDLDAFPARVLVEVV